MESVLKIDQKQGLLDPVSYCPSAHHDARPEGAAIDMIVVHGISLPPGEFGSSAIEDFFCGKLESTAHPYFKQISNLRVSSHLLIKRNGAIVQFVPFDKRAWHAGESSFEGKTRCNDFSVGIELEGTDHLPYELAQYQQLSKVIQLLMRVYPKITPQRVVGHEHIAAGRKTDPGPAFDWNLLRGMMA